MGEDDANVATMADIEGAYLTVADSIKDNISVKQFIQALQQSGRNPTQKSIDDYSNGKSKISYRTFQKAMKKEKKTNMKDLMAAFKKIDKNGDGVLTHAELFSAFTKNGEKMTRKEVREMIDEADENGDGVIDYEEFCKMIIKTSKKSMKKVIDGNYDDEENDERKDSSHMKKDKSSSKKTTKKKFTYDSDSSDNDIDDDLNAKKGLRKSLSPPGRKTPTKKLKNLNVLADSDSENNIFGSSKKTRRTPSPLGKKKSGRKDAVDSDSDEHIKTPLSRKKKDSSSRDKKEDDDEEESIYKVGSGRRSKTPDRRKSRSPSRRSPSPGLNNVDDDDAGEFKKWHTMQTRGAFSVEEDGAISSHLFRLELTRRTDVAIIIRRDKHDLYQRPMDLALAVMREDDDDLEFVVSSETSMTKQSILRHTLNSGTYVIVPFTSGCKLRKRDGALSKQRKVKLSATKKGLSKEAKAAIMDVFQRGDLDMSGGLSRVEFDMLQLRTNGEEADNESWKYMQKKFDTNRDGDITKKGFVQLYEAMLEAEGAEVVWKDLTALGFNSMLELDEACQFKLFAYAEECDPSLEILPFQADQLNQAVIHGIIMEGEPTELGNGVVLHRYKTSHRQSFAVENQCERPVTVQVNCTGSKNAVTHQDSMKHSLTIDGGEVKLAHHLVRDDPNKDWTVKHKEIVK